MASRRFIIEAIMNAEQARQTLKALARDIDAVKGQQAAVNVAGQRYLQSMFPGVGVGADADASKIDRFSSSISRAGNALKVVSNISSNTKTGFELLGLTTTNYTGNVELLTAAIGKYGAALDQAIGRTKQASAEIQTLKRNMQTAVATANQAVVAAQQRAATSRTTLAGITQYLAPYKQDVVTGRAEVVSAREAFARGDISQGAYSASIIRLQAAEAALAQATQGVAAQRTAARSELQKAILAEKQANAAINTANLEYASKRRAAAAASRADVGALGLTGLQAGIQTALNAPPPLPGVFQTLSGPGGSRDLLRRLQQAGLGGGAAFGSQQFTQNLIAQGAFESFNLEKDLVRNVTRVTGAFTDQQGVLNRVTAEYDKSGKVITRFGSHMSGLGNVLSQIGRDFQKVIEFAIATTVVFGALRFAINEVRVISEIDKGLRQFSITAGITKEEARGLFEELANIGIATATPLQEIVKAADDIALATREAGQSTREWRQDILSLTQSVGILTNLAGISTVEATDQLVATMKQLNLEAQELPGILNKITAVAGGQSNAIADVIKGLGVLAEAGKQAGLSIDEMIATVQTLSQVTSKSPSEVATALKQLIGALDGPAGSKALAQYNIELRDSAGNLRNIVDIYSEIQDKIRQGIIPADEVKALVRAIAGGPRRAPDAAALLSAINDIQQVTEKSISATNEALLANAKILDTNQAKFIQLQARFDKFATTKFSDILSQGLTGLANVLDGVLTILEFLPSQAYLTVIQFGLLAGAVKFLTSVTGFAAGSFLGLAASIKAAGIELGIFKAQAVTTPPVVTPTLLGPTGLPIAPTAKTGLSALTKRQILGATLPSLAVGAATGLASAASGVNTLSAIGTGIQTAGLVGLLSPLTKIHPLFTAVAGTATLAGTALQFFGGMLDQNKPKMEGNTEELLNAINAYKEISEQIANLSEEQQSLGSSIEDLLSDQERTTAQTEQLTDFQKQYAANAVEMINANIALGESFDNLNEIMSKFPAKDELGQVVGRFQIEAARAGRLTPEQLRDLTIQLAPSILKATNPNFVAPNEFFLPTPTTLGNIGPAISPNQTAVVLEQANKGTREVNINLLELENNVTGIRQLFNETGTEITAAFDPAANNLDAIDIALQSIKDDIAPEEWERLAATFQEYAAQVNALYAAQRNVALYQAYIEAGAAVGLFTPEQAKNGRAILGLYEKLVTLSTNLPTQAPRRGGVPRPEIYQQEAFQIATQFAFPGGQLRTTVPSPKEAKEFGEAILKATESIEDLGLKGVIMETIKQLFLDAGLAVEGWTTAVEVATASNDEFLESLQNLTNQGLSQVADKMADLQARFQGGEFAENPEVFQRQMAQQLAIANGLEIVTKRYEKLGDTVANIDQVTQILSKTFTSIPGLIDAQSLKTTELIQRMFELGNRYGLTGDQVLLLVQKMIKLSDIIAQIDKLRPVLTIIADLDMSAAIAKLRALAAAQQKLSGIATGDINQAARARYNQYDAAADLLEDLDKLGRETEQLYRSGAGTSFSSPKTSTAAAAKGPDVSTLDIPDVIAQAYNRDALLQEAIRRARALQVLIPGATAEARDDIVELLYGTQRILEVRGTKDDLLRKALEELAEIEKKRLEQETKADTIRRIQVGTGSFAAIANVPVNARTGVSLGGAEGPINITLNLNSTVLTPAQFQQFADMVAASIKRQLSS